MWLLALAHCRDRGAPVAEERSVAMPLLATSSQENSKETGPQPLDESHVSAVHESGEGEAGAEAGRHAQPGMLLVPAGVFWMGADSGGQGDERPAHEVSLPAFWLDVTEVTNEAYEACVRAGVCAPHDVSSAEKNHLGKDAEYRAPLQPISGVSWFDAQRYCAWQGKRLPREAEWERAARGDDRRRYPWGDEPPDHERAVFATARTAAVGTHPLGQGPFGHMDLAGNVWEWTADAYDPYAYRREGAQRGDGGSCAEITKAQDELRSKGIPGFTGSNPIPTECEQVLRGGAFNYDGPGLRSSNRVHHPARFKLIMSGFRCAKS